MCDFYNDINYNSWLCRKSSAENNNFQEWRLIGTTHAKVDNFRSFRRKPCKKQSLLTLRSLGG